MRILIDLQGAQNGSRHRGIGRYSLALAKAIVRNKGDHEIFIALNALFPETIDSIRQSFIDLLPSHHIIVFDAAGPVDALPAENSWRVRTAELLREKFINDLAPDVLLISSLFEGGNDNTITSVGQLFSHVPTAVILYDLIPYLDPEKYIGREPEKIWYYEKIAALKRSDLLLAISDSAQREAIEHLGVDQQRSINISSAADALFSKATLTPEESSTVLTRYGIKRNFLMHSSAFEERKNFEGLVKAFGALPKNLQKKYQLVLVCKINGVGRRSLTRLAASVGLDEDDLVLTGYVSDDDLVTLYSECYLFVFPSFHEGFGLPALEAMSCGAATIGSNTSSIPEVIGLESALFDPKSTESMAALIERILTDTVFWQSLKDHAKIQSQKFSWDQSAKIAIEGFEKLQLKSLLNKRLLDPKNTFTELIDSITRIQSGVVPSERDLIQTATRIEKNENVVNLTKSFADFCGQLRWRIEGPFDSTYSLALLNRETARALEELGHFVILHSTEGPGDFAPSQEFLQSNPNLALMNSRVPDYPHNVVDVASRNLYPPRVADMASPLNLLHHYAWEESGFPQDWVANFNANLNGITCLSNHVEKILIDNGVDVSMLTSGCGVDHWERIEPANSYHLEAKQFRFLHVSSCFPRKGVDLLLDAYGNTFTSDENVTLVIKTFENPHNEIYKWLEERKNKNNKFPHVLIIEGDLSDSELKSLYKQCHVLVAPSRAEGFGLPMAEAMLSGLPVITTAWGGQLDFCNADNSWLVDYQFERAKTHFGLFSSVWAKINVDELGKALSVARNLSQDQLRSKALSGRKFLLENFKWIDVVGRAVNAVHTWRKAPEEPVAKIGWISTWNTKCGIAGYSKHLISNMQQENITILAPNQEPLIYSEEENCIRCWTFSKDWNNFDETSKFISTKKLNTLVIQFNYGFYNFAQFSNFIDQQLENGLIVIIMMHSTVDPENLTTSENWKLATLQTTLSRCHRILVHSVPDLNRLKAIGLTDNVALFPHGFRDYQSTGSSQEPELVPAKVNNNLPLIASYGFCLPHKGLVELVEAIGMLKEQGKTVRLRLVNAEYPDPSSTQMVSQLNALIKELNIQDLVELHTKFLTDNESLDLLSDADILVFAYQQTGESSSAAVRHGLSTKRPVAVTPLSIFEDIGNAAFRFKGTSSAHIAQGISEYLNEISQQSEHSRYIETEAKRWRDSHNFAVVSKRLIGICTAFLRKHPPRKYYLHGSSPLLSTVVGTVQGKDLFSTGKAGNLVHGPYIPLETGQYRVTIRGTVGASGSAGAMMYVTANKGQILGESPIGANEIDDDCLVSLPILLNTPCSDLAVRVWVSDDTDLKISMIEIVPYTEEQKSCDVGSTSFSLEASPLEDESHTAETQQEQAQALRLANKASNMHMT